MKLKFTKMQGCGNDYLYINCFENVLKHPEQVSKILSDRHFGVGGDGIILICPSETADAKMRIFNQDGSEGKMCGNGIRCVGKYLYDTGMVKKTELNVETLSGIKTLRLFLKGDTMDSVAVDMGKAELTPEKIPVKLEGERIIGVPVKIDGILWRITCVSMGNPHCVVFCSDVDGLDLPALGPSFENNSLFPERVNTEFVQVIDSHTIKRRVWERGSGETWACGTGACAAAVASVLNGFCEKNQEITVHLRGGDLKILDRGDTVIMTGEARTVFTGEAEL